MTGIILVNYNNFVDTLECIDSILNTRNKEQILIVVVDNCSTDNSFSMLKESSATKHFSLIKSDSNNGFSAGNNLGIKYCYNHHCDYILLLNNDTIVTDYAIDNLINGFKYDDACGLTTSKILYYYDKNKIWYNGGSISKHTSRTIHHDFNNANYQEKIDYKLINFASGCCMCLTKKAIDIIGLLDESYFLYEEDTDYCLRLAKKFKMILIPNSIIYHKVSSSTGQGSALSQYYTVRNKYKLIQNNYHGLNKVNSYLFSTLQFFIRILRRNYKIKYFIKGFKGFIKGEEGKSNESFID